MSCSISIMQPRCYVNGVPTDLWDVIDERTGSLKIKKDGDEGG